MRGTWWKAHAAKPSSIGFAFEGAITTLIGESGSGKTFVALSMAAAVSDGREWHGCSVNGGSVAYVTFEGDALNARLRAIKSSQGIGISNVHVLVANDPVSLRRRDGAELPSSGEASLQGALGGLISGLETNAPPIRLIVIDTLRASLAGSEDDSDTIAAYLRMVRRLLARVPRAGALLIHHSGWQDGETPRKRERGSSALRGTSITRFSFGRAAVAIRRLPHTSLWKR